MNELDVSGLISVARAIEIIDGAAVSPEMISAPLMESRGLHLADDIVADRDYPPFDKCLMDGYALTKEDAGRAPCELPVAARIPAGQVMNEPLRTGSAMAIMTGAPIPAGAEVIVPVEETESLSGGRRVRINRADGGDRYIARVGSDVRKGTVVLEKGAAMGAAQIAVAASVGAARVDVFRPASVAVLGTGDEIVGFDRLPGGAQIRGSNNAMLMAQLQALGCRATDLGNCLDEPAAIRKAIAGAASYDALLITGGVSMGERDFVPGILQELGGVLRITKVRIKPGKPFVFAEMPGGKYAFGLPGNPVSALVCAIRFASRLLRRIGGGPADEVFIHATLSSPLKANGPREFYQPAVLRDRVASPLHWKGSADIFTLARSNALIVRQENEPARNTGDQVMVLLI